MKLLGWLLRLAGIVVLGLAVSGAWLFRHELARRFRGGEVRAAESPVPGEHALARARDKIDSLHGWSADSVVLSAAEAGALLVDGLPAEARRHLDSVVVTLGPGAVTVRARLETAAIPAGDLGPLAGALDPWEPVTAAGPVTVSRHGEAVWQVRALTLRGITLPEAASRRLIEKALGEADDGAILLALPRGIADLHIRPDGVSLFREETR